MLQTPLASTVRATAVAWMHRGPLWLNSSSRKALLFLPPRCCLSSTGRTTTTTRSSSTSGSSEPTTTARPFRILGLQQVAIGHTDRPALHRLWIDVLGIAPTHSNIRIPSENVVEDILSIGGGHDDTPCCAVEIDLMTPIDPEKTPKVRF